MKGKSINLYLMDGEPSGRIKCTLANWTGIAYKIPRLQLEECKDRDDLKQSGVYFLFGHDDETDKFLVYVGQAGARKNGEGILNRLSEHKKNPDKDYWNEAVAFTTQNNSFGPTEISYLEHSFCELAKDANRFIVKNGNDPTIGNIAEEKESELQEFIEHARMIMGVLGYKVFEPLVSYSKYDGSTEAKTKERVQLFFTQKGIIAQSMRTEEGIVLLSGSQISDKLTKSCPEYIVKLRTLHKDKIDADNKTTEDILFSSPSAAAAFVGGASLKSATTYSLRQPTFLITGSAK